MPLIESEELRASRRAITGAPHAGTIRAYFPFWDTQYRPFLIAAVNAFPEDHLDYKPRPEMLTAREMIVHIAETERGWIHNVAGGGTYEEWVEPADDPAQGWRLVVDAPDRASLLARLEEWHRPTQRWLDQPEGELARVVTRRTEDGVERRYTLHWILGRVQEHEIHHRAMLNLYLRLLGIEPPSI